jgi:hypothetical protein
MAARAIFGQAFESELPKLISGSDAQRRTVAKVAQHLMGNEEYAAACISIGRQLAADSDEEVQQHLSMMFRQGLLVEVPGGSELALAFAASPGFMRNPQCLFDAIGDFAGDLRPFGDFLHDLIDAVIKQAQSPHTDHSMFDYMADRELPAILLRLYDQLPADDANARQRCLDQWDALIRTNTHAASELLAELDR